MEINESNSIVPPSSWPLMSLNEADPFIVRQRVEAYTSLLQAMFPAMMGDVDQTRRLIDRAEELIKDLSGGGDSTSEDDVQLYLSNLWELGEALIPFAEAMEAYMLVDFVLTRQHQKQTKIILRRAIKGFREDIADSAFWKGIAVYLNKYVELLEYQCAADNALYHGDLYQCAISLGKVASLTEEISELIPVAAFEKVWGEWAVDLSRMMNLMYSQLRDQLTRQSRMQSHKARLVKQYADLVDKPSWRTRLLFFTLWLVGITIITLIFKWSAIQIDGNTLLLWSTINAGVAVGLLGLKEALTFQRKIATQKELQSANTTKDANES